MNRSKGQLEGRKQEVLEALRILEQDREDGLMDEAGYASGKLRLEHEAAALIAQLDDLSEDDGPKRKDGRAPAARLWRPRVLAVAGLVLALVGLHVYLIAGLQHRGSGGAPTAAIPGGTGAPAQSALTLQAAEQAVYLHPRSYEALVNLGTAYLQNGRIMEADLSYQAASRMDPTRAAAPTFHAMLLGSVKRYQQALAILSDVERSHPAYARAWLMDGVLSSHVRTGKQRAVSSWLRFLLLEPQSDLAPKVRRWIVQLKRKR